MVNFSMSNDEMFLGMNPQTPSSNRSAGVRG
jgi:hypothetical protein